ncbi:acetylornithine deacetylase/succinyl-diaminopimelate desuccinylase-like protein [Sinorhizobium fredii]
MKTPEDILAQLISFPSVVGTANHDIVEWIRTYLTELGAKVSVLPGPEGDRSNLFATIGPRPAGHHIVGTYGRRAGRRAGLDEQSVHPQARG